MARTKAQRSASAKKGAMTRLTGRRQKQTQRSAAGRKGAMTRLAGRRQERAQRSQAQAKRSSHSAVNIVKVAGSAIGKTAKSAAQAVLHRAGAASSPRAGRGRKRSR